MRALSLSATATVALFAGIIVAAGQTSSTTTTTVAPNSRAIGGAATMVLTPEQHTTVKQYVVKQKHPSAKLQEKVTVGAAVPQTVQLYEIQGIPAVQQYRYTVVNDQYVLVDPGTRRVVQIIE